MKQIEHIPNEKRQPWWLWWVVFGVLALMWFLQLRHETEWGPVMLGLGTGALITAWAMDITGGGIPASWRRKTRRER